MPALRSTSAICAIALCIGTASAQTTAAQPAAPLQSERRPIEISARQGTWMNVDVSPDGREIAFDLLGDIYVMPAAGGTARPIASGPALQLYPRFSPDGGRIAFVSDESGSDNLWIANRDGGGARQVSREASAFLSKPSWRRDGLALVATKATTTQLTYLNGDLFLYYLDGSSGLKLVDGQKIVDDGQFSADGKSIYYSQDVSGPTTVFHNPLEANFAIRRNEIASDRMTELVRGYGGALTPTLSPAGDRIAFVRRVGTKTLLFVADLDTGRQTPVYDGLTRDSQADPLNAGAYPRFGWFPDNRTVAIWAKGKLLRIDTVTGETSDIPFQAKATHQIVPALRHANPISDDPFTIRTVRGPVTTPDGRTTIFSALGRLWRKTGNAPPVRLTNEDALESEPSLRADGREIVFVHWTDEGGSEIRAIPVSGGRSRTLHHTPAIVRSPTISADGRRIAFALAKAEGNLGGHGFQHGLYLLGTAGGKPSLVIAEGTRPRFNRAGDRLFYTMQTPFPGSLALKSVALSGLDVREHATAPAGIAFEVSPDERWIAFEEQSQISVAPFPPRSVALTATTGEVPVRRLPGPGSEAHWSGPDTIAWMLGDVRHSAGVAALFGPDPAKHDESHAIGLTAPVDRPAGMLALVGARLITMRGDEVIEDGVVLVDGARIIALGKRGDVAIPPAARAIDVGGKTIMPGLIDAHAHAHLATMTTAPQKYPPYYGNLAFGVTTLFDPSAGGPSSFERAEMVRAGTIVGPRIFSVGPILLGLSGGPPYSPIRSIDDARMQLRARQAYGTAYVKSYVQPTRLQRQQVLQAARELGMMVVPEGSMHFYLDLSMITDGHTTVEHGIPLPEVHDDVTKLLQATNVALTPTITVAAGSEGGENSYLRSEKAWQDPRVRSFVPEILDLFGGYRPPYLRSSTVPATPDELYDNGYRALAGVHRQLNDAGVLVNTGAHGHFSGLGLHWELWMLKEGGMTNMQALRAATLNPATTLGLDGDLGSLAPGKLADLVVLDRNPLDDIRATQSVRYTMANGRLYDSVTMNEIGLRNRPRTRFYWELPGASGLEWRNVDMGTRSN